MNNVPEHLDPAKWAAMLGLIPPLCASLQIHDETEREHVFQERFYCNIQTDHISAAIIGGFGQDLWTEFTAKYLPSLVDRLLDLPPHGTRPGGAEDYPLQNIYHTTLRAVSPHYLDKFMSSSHAIAEGGKRLPRVMAERLVEFAPNSLRKDTRGSHVHEECIHRAVSTLSMLIMSAKAHAVPKKTRTTLVHWLDTWAAYDGWSPESMSPNNNLPLACTALKFFLEQRRYGIKSIGFCALPTCGMSTNLKACARCKTVVYCSKAHQTQDWKRGDGSHKKWCFETEY